MWPSFRLGNFQGFNIMIYNTIHIYTFGVRFHICLLLVTTWIKIAQYSSLYEGGYTNLAQYLLSWTQRAERYKPNATKLSSFRTWRRLNKYPVKKLNLWANSVNIKCPSFVVETDRLSKCTILCWQAFMTNRNRGSDWKPLATGGISSQLSSTLMQLLFSFYRGMRVEKTLMQTLASQLSSTLMQLLFSFDRDMRVEKTLMQTLASQLSCNSCSRLTGAWELRKLWCKLSLLNSHQLSCNSCSRLSGAWEFRKLSCKLSLLNSHATLVLVWPDLYKHDLFQERCEYRSHYT
jgi:hypothetical protein